jgi:acetoin utilization protein AcuB
VRPGTGCALGAVEVNVVSPVREPRTHAWAVGTPSPVPVPGTTGAVMSCDLVTVDVGVSLEQALAKMEAAGIHHLLLTDRERIVAVVSDRNLVRVLGLGPPKRDDERHRRHPVFQVASYRVTTIEERAPIAEAAATLLDHGISALPVVNDADEVVGIVTSRDLLRHLALASTGRASERPAA